MSKETKSPTPNQSASAAGERLTGRECCVPDAGEPSFVLLGRDPQAPALVEEWARVRSIIEPDSPKVGMAREIAAKMAMYKVDHEEQGVSSAAYLSALSPSLERKPAPVQETVDEAVIELVLAKSNLSNGEKAVLRRSIYAAPPAPERKEVEVSEEMVERGLAAKPFGRATVGELLQFGRGTPNPPAAIRAAIAAALTEVE